MERSQGNQGDGGKGAADAEVVRVLQRALDQAQHELVAANDELHSTVQELHSTTTELRSTTETLEKLTAELESTAGDVREIDAELRQRSVEIDESRAFVTTVLDSLDRAVIAVKPDLGVRTWNHHAQELWGLRTRDAVSRPLLSLDIGLPVAELEAPLRTTLEEPGVDQSFELDGSSRDNRALRYSIRCLPLRSNDGHIAGAVIVAAPMPV